jgi:ASC-1-like (ASCH) protein
VHVVSGRSGIRITNLRRYDSFKEEIKNPGVQKYLSNSKVDLRALHVLAETGGLET